MSSVFFNVAPLDGGEVMAGVADGAVVASRSAVPSDSDRVVLQLGWCELAVAPFEPFRRIELDGVSTSRNAGVSGLPDLNMDGVLSGANCCKTLVRPVSDAA